MAILARAGRNVERLRRRLGLKPWRQGAQRRAGEAGVADPAAIVEIGARRIKRSLRVLGFYASQSARHPQLRRIGCGGGSQRRDDGVVRKPIQAGRRLPPQDQHGHNHGQAACEDHPLGRSAESQGHRGTLLETRTKA